MLVSKSHIYVQTRTHTYHYLRTRWLPPMSPISTCSSAKRTYLVWPGTPGSSLNSTLIPVALSPRMFEHVRTVTMAAIQHSPTSNTAPRSPSQSVGRSCAICACINIYMYHYVYVTMAVMQHSPTSNTGSGRQVDLGSFGLLKIN
jgi:hypothetical protein